MTRTIDITPTWAAAVEVYMAVLENPSASPEGLDSARSELRRLARALDDLNADPAAKDEESDSARWRAERRLERLDERDELDLY